MSELIRALDLSKSYPGVKALDQVSVSVNTGEILAIVGENGAGKSTLMKILAGLVRADEGSIFFEGEPCEMLNARDALDRGIALIHQELNLAPDLSVAENIFLGHEPMKGVFIRRKEMLSQSKILLEKVGLTVEPDHKVAELTIGKQQLVEIAKALSYEAKLLIFDEPSSSLSQQETDLLLLLIQELKARGIGIVYISHRLKEVEAIADRVVVLKDGQYQGEVERKDISKERLVAMMVGRDISFEERDGEDIGVELIELKEVSTKEYPSGQISLQIKRGEIVGIAGLVGAGRTSLLEAMFGLDPFLQGQVIFNGKSVVLRSTKQALDLGIGLVPEDRKQNGLFLTKTIAENVVITSLAKDSSLSLLDNKNQSTLAKRAIDNFSIACRSENDLSNTLSGGNQQKIVLAKWIELNPALLLLDEPTRGVDVGAKQEIYELLRIQASKGTGILFASSDLEEILRFSDRVLVMRQGNMVGDLRSDEISEESIMSLATGTGKAA